MSKVQLQGNVSGTGVFTIASPNSNTDRTLTLPNQTGTILTNASTAGFPAGSVLQVVQYVIPAASYTTFNGFNVNTQIQGSITPSSATSKILVAMNYMIGTATTSLAMCTAQITRNGTSIFYLGQIAGNVVATRAVQNASHMYLDSPNTTSSTAYRLQVNSVDGATCYIGAWGFDPVSWQSPTMLTLMEIAA